MQMSPCTFTRHETTLPLTACCPAGYEPFGSAIVLLQARLQVQQVAPEWGFARTNSAGTVKVNATGGGGPEANQELFVFQKVDGSWKIARYCFSTTNPPK